MYTEAQKLHLIEELLKVDDDAILNEVEIVLAKNRPESTARKSFKAITGMISPDEVDELKRIIEEGCEQITEDEAISL